MSKVVDIQGRQARPPKILVGVPSHALCAATFAYDWAQLSAYTVAALPEGVEIGAALVSGTYVHQARQEILEHALATGVTHLLWLDSDMRFPKQALVHLLERGKDFVGINYSTRGLPPSYVAIKQISNPPTRLVTDDESEGLEEVEALGFGCTLMRLGPLQALPKGERWFWFEDLGNGEQVGEDVYFCRLAREACGVDIYVDHDLSKHCAHTGFFEFELGHVRLFGEGEEGEA